jgi:hypothetical protein
MKPGIIFPLFTVAAMLLAAVGMVMPRSTAQADIGWPPLSPGGSSLEAPEGVNTNVRMVSEEVNLTVEPFERTVPKNKEDSPAFHMRALVEAVFQMRNLESADESFDVWFPLAASLRYRGMLPYWPDNIVTDFKVWVDGEPTATKQVQAPDAGDPTQQSTWARFPMTFPAGQDVVVRVNYTLYPSGRRPFGGFEYILQTGAGWKDTIGKAVINVYLPDTVTAENVSLSGKSVEGLPIAPQPEGYTIENNVIHWELTDLEPKEKDNIYVDVLEPERYRELVRARARLASEPASADAQVAYARAAIGAVMLVKSVGQHGGGTALGEQINAAYRKALELDPRADIYLEYIRWLRRSSGSSLFTIGVCPEELCAVVAQALQAYPGNVELIAFDEEIKNLQAQNAPYATQYATDRTTTADVAARQAAQQAQSGTATAEAAVVQATQAALSATGVAQSAQATAARATDLAAPAATPTPAAQTPGGFSPAVWVPVAVIAVLFVLIGLRQKNNQK